MSTDASSHTMECPDPSAHQKGHKLSEQASTAALYVTHPERATAPPQVLNPDGKLSSKSAATSLRYARPQDLPSYPTHGIDTANSAGQAAMLAKDYRMKDLWQPEMSSAGSRAALLAHKDGGKLDLWQPSASADGNSAAKLAMRNKTLSPQLDYGYTKDGRSNALLAATKSQKDGRQRAGSTPAPALPVYPDAANSAHNALNAATVSHRASTKATNPREPDGWDSAAMQAARIQNVGDHMDREMFTEHPPVEIEKQEKRERDALRASTISMAKQMYDYQNNKDAMESRGARPTSSAAPTDIKQEAMRYIHLQDAAHKLAQERLAKVDKNFENMRYREYYGYNTTPQKSRLSMGGFMRRRASSEAGKDELDSDDEEQARRVRNQMSQFSTALASVDAKKQQNDRDALLAIAQKRVQKSMSDMDAKVFQDTGKVSQTMMDEWESKAKKRATEDAEKREVNRGKTHIGAGKYMDTAEIEAIAQARLKPTLDEIDANAAQRRQHDAEVAHEKEEQEKFKHQEKVRHREGKEEWKRFKDDEKANAKREKEERKAVEEPSNRRSLLSRLSVKRKSREAGREEGKDAAAAAATGATLGEVAEKVKESTDDAPAVHETSSPVVASSSPAHATQPAAKQESTLPLAAIDQPDMDTANSSSVEAVPEQSTTKADAVEEEPGKPKGIKGLFSKLRHRKDENVEPTSTAKTFTPATTATTTTPVATTAATTTAATTTSAVVGDAAAADDQHEKAVVTPAPVVADSVTEPPTLPQHTGTEIETPETQHVGDVAGGPAAISPSSFRRRDADGDDADVSSLSSSGIDEDDFKEGRTGRSARALRSNKTAPGVISAMKPAENELDDEDEETFEEARDTVDPSSAPEPSFVGQKNTATQGRETKFQEVGL